MIKLAIRDKCTVSEFGSSRKDRLKSVLLQLLGNCMIAFVFLLPVGVFAVVFFSRVCIVAFMATLQLS